MLKIKRVYEPPARGDGKRVLVDRLWPRGLKKADAKIELWLKDIAPSRELRMWFQHDPEKWDEFKRRYFKELKALPPDTRDELSQLKHSGITTLLFGAKDERYNNAVALREYLAHAPAGRSRKHSRQSAR